MVSSSMRVQITGLSRLIITPLTLKWFFTGVSVEMLSQVTFVAGNIATYRASMRWLFLVQFNHSRGHIFG